MNNFSFQPPSPTLKYLNPKLTNSLASERELTGSETFTSNDVSEFKFREKVVAEKGWCSDILNIAF